MIYEKEYIVDGVVEREKIALDIKYGKIKKSDLDVLISNNDIKEAFFGDGFHDKKPKNQWNKEYLNILSYVCIGEAFNAEYLYYLSEVAEYVNHMENEKIKHKNTNKKLIIGASVVIIGIAVIGIFVMKFKRNML